METGYRIPRIRVIIKRPNWKKTDSLEEFTIVTFDYSPCSDEDKSKAGAWWKDAKDYNAKSDGLLSYTYSESRKDVDSAFTLSITPEQDKNKLTWADKIAQWDIVFIEEFNKIRYVGIVHKIRYSTRIGENGPERTISVEGNGFGELLKRFQLVLDTKLFIQAPAEIEDLRAKSEFITEGDKSLEGAITFYYEHFKKLISERGAGEQSVLKHIIEKYVVFDVDKNCKTFLPICQNLYQMGVNTIWDILRKIVPEPMYELFGRWDTKKNKYVIIARQCPYKVDDWKSLPIHKIKPVTLKEANIGRDDSDVYTVYYATAPSFGYTNNMVMVVDNLHKNIKIDDDRWKKYGYQPLSVELSFLKRDDIQPNNVEDALVKIGELLASWYENNDQYLAGVLSVISYEDNNATYPTVGNRLNSLGGEFYIDEIKRRWTYGNSPTSDINVIRGGRYSDDGKFMGTIPELSNRLNEIAA